MKIVIFGVAGTDGDYQECQSGEFGEQETRDCMSFGVGGAVEVPVARSNCLFVGERVGIGDVELDFGVLDGLVERDIGPVLRKEYAHTATAQSTTLQESVNQSEVVLGWGVEEAVLDSSLGR